MNDTKLPSTPEVADELLRFLYLRSSVQPQAMYGELANLMCLTTQQRLLKRRTRNESLWNNRVQTARKRLVEQGYVNSDVRGEWSLTPYGRDAAKGREWLKTASLDDLGL